MEDRLKALEKIYHALWFDVVKHDLEVSPYVEEAVYEFEKQYVTRDQWMKPCYKHAPVKV